MSDRIKGDRREAVRDGGIYRDKTWARVKRGRRSCSEPQEQRVSFFQISEPNKGASHMSDST